MLSFLLSLVKWNASMLRFSLRRSNAWRPLGNEFRRRTETFFSAHLTRTPQNRRGDPSPCKTITIKSHAVACDHHYNASLYYRWQLLPSHPSVSWVDASQAATRLHWYAAHCFPLLVAAIRRNRLFGHFCDSFKHFSRVVRFACSVVADKRWYKWSSLIDTDFFPPPVRESHLSGVSALHHISGSAVQTHSAWQR